MGRTEAKGQKSMVSWEGWGGWGGRSLGEL